MNVVTISRQLGSLGFEIAQSLAEQLGYRLVWRELINQAAIRAGAPEVALAMIDELNLLGICPSPEKCQAYFEAVEKVLHELADQGEVVIVGRGGQLVLRGHPQVLHVRIVAPLEVRVDRVAASKSVSPKAALAQIKASDRTRRLYFQKFYQADWDEPTLYDLILNTGRIPPDAAVEMIRQALSLPRLESKI
jgi:cytidylate kinase